VAAGAGAVDGAVVGFVVLLQPQGVEAGVLTFVLMSVIQIFLYQ
jgi:hypothetical protein